MLLEAGPDVLPACPPSLRGRAVRDLGALGVDVRLGATVTSVDPGGVTIAARDAAEGRLDARTVIWAAGVAPSPLARRLAEASGTALDGAGRLFVRPDLSMPGHPEVFAIGDMAALPGVPKPTRTVWSGPAEPGYLESMTTAGTVVAPLLAGFSATLAGLLLDDGIRNDVRWPDIAILAFIIAVLFFVFVVQATITMRSRAATPADMLQSFPTGTPTSGVTSSTTRTTC